MFEGTILTKNDGLTQPMKSKPATLCKHNFEQNGPNGLLNNVEKSGLSWYTWLKMVALDPKIPDAS